jgi:hypothetical protein
MTIRIGGISLAAACLLASPTGLPAQDSPQEEALEAARSWVALVDSEEYRESWDEAARSFQASVTPEAWSAQLSAGRAQVGAVEERGDPRVEAMVDPPGAPPGEYVQVIFRSRYSGAGYLMENVVLTREEDRGWRVVGYFIQPPG